MDFQIITTTSEFEEMEKEWNSLLNTSITNVPFLRHEYLLGWWKTLGGGEWEKGELLIITASENGCIIGIAPFFLTKADIEKKENTLLLLGSFEISDYLDLIVAEKNLEQFITGLFGFLMDNLQLSWERLDLFNVPEHSTSISHIKKAAESHGWEFLQERFRPTVSVELAGDFDTYLAGIDKKQRHEVRRKMRRASEYDLPVTWNILDDESLLET
ncbi:GNAT family N-acetyltransferase, partial [Chloroflexota bacterium]